MEDINPFDEISISNPAQLARALIGNRSISNVLDKSSFLKYLDEISDSNNFNDRTYSTQTSRALALPIDFDKNKPVKYIDFGDLMFEGRFICFSIIEIGKLIGIYTVKAVCIVFENALLIPYFETVPNDKLLHVPVLAVDSMTPTDY